MSKKLKLTKIELETKAGEKVELSIDEARELHGQLDELFGKHYVPSQPLIIERERPPWRYWYQVPLTSTWQSNVSPNNGGLDVQCNTTGQSGLKIGYAGHEVTA